MQAECLRCPRSLLLYFIKLHGHKRLQKEKNCLQSYKNTATIKIIVSLCLENKYTQKIVF